MRLSATEILAHLNDEQCNVVTWCEGPMLVLAGAGSGKTRAVTHKIAWLLAEEGYLPHEILAVTFTNKAAQEMKKRVVKLVGLPGNGVEMGTFHAVCARILRQNAEKIGFSASFGILDTDDGKVLMRHVIRDLQLDDKTAFPPARLHSIADSLLNRRTLVSDWVLETSDSGQRAWRQMAAQILGAYENRKQSLNMMDFSDLLDRTERLLRDFPEVRAEYNRRFRYVIVDEMQDTNATQLELLKLLVGPHLHLCAVGDDDQSIYGWRGARIENMLEFEKAFPGARIVRMEQNYRSTNSILEAAHSVIHHNRRRRPKKLWTENSQGEPLRMLQTDSDSDEAMKVASFIQRHHADGIAYRQMAVLYRTNAQSRSFEEILAQRSIPYVVVGGLRFYERAEIKDALAYLRLVNNPRDELAFRRIVNTPPRGIGDVSLEKLAALTGNADDTLYQKACSLRTAEHPEKWHGALVKFVELIERCRSMAPTMSIKDLLLHVLEESGYYERLEALDELERESRGQNLGQLVSGIAQYEEEREALEDGKRATLASYLEDVALLTDVDLWKEEQDRIPLMTVHAAKGLEFEVVFVVGMEEGLFPYRGREGDQDVEEERRLFYVALTRAAKQVYLLHSGMRRQYGQVMECTVSPFLGELDPSVVRTEGRRSRRSFQQAYAGKRQPEQTAPGREPDPPSAWTGRYVSHPRYGRGKVLATMGAGASLVLVAKFGSDIATVPASECDG